ncbi:MAG: Uncharacterised protein [Opitutia bacterium UBA7350]|nr:MAG: Uncharacterised protein [Opitutae bacterium UBA7350]
MSILDKLEKRIGHWAIPNVMLGLIVAQLLVYLLILVGKLSFGAMPLIPSLVLGEGEFWRLFTFIVSPPKIAGGALSGLFLAIFWYILWMMSQSLESNWGAFRFNLYLLAGVFFTVVCAFIGQVMTPTAPIVIFPDFLYLSIFWAFALLHPNMEFYLFFVLPVKVKWLALLTGFFTVLTILMAGSTGAALAELGPVLNFVLFYRVALIESMRSKRRRSAYSKEVQIKAESAQHTCLNCGATERSDPGREFRYRMEAEKAICTCSVCRENLAKKPRFNQTEAEL